MVFVLLRLGEISSGSTLSQAERRQPIGAARQAIAQGARPGIDSFCCRECCLIWLERAHQFAPLMIRGAFSESTTRTKTSIVVGAEAAANAATNDTPRGPQQDTARIRLLSRGGTLITYSLR